MAPRTRRHLFLDDSGAIGALELGCDFRFSARHSRIRPSQLFSPALEQFPQPCSHIDLAPGTHRYYGVYYRDPTVLGGCWAASTFNITQQLKVVWSLRLRGSCSRSEHGGTAGATRRRILQRDGESPWTAVAFERCVHQGRRKSPGWGRCGPGVLSPENPTRVVAPLLRAS